MSLRGSAAVNHIGHWEIDVAGKTQWTESGMNGKDNELGVLYLATTFRVEAPDGIIDIRVGEKRPRIDALLALLSANE